MSDTAAVLSIAVCWWFLSTLVSLVLLKLAAILGKNNTDICVYHLIFCILASPVVTSICLAFIFFDLWDLASRTKFLKKKLF